MSDIHTLIRPELLTIKPFDASRPGFTSSVLLDANELPWESTSFNDVSLNRYVDDMFDPTLLATLAAYYETKPSQILLTRGSCEGIDLLVRAFCRPAQDAIMVCPPTFSIFAQCAMMQDAKVQVVPLQAQQGYTLNKALLLKSITDTTKLVFICTPNNPTGNLIPLEDIVAIIEVLQGKAMVVVDEAYMEFANGQSAASFVERYSNLVVLRTFSKAFGLAALRCGALIAQEPLIQILTGMMMPFPFSLLTLQALKQALTNEKLGKMKHYIQEIQTQRELFKQDLERLPVVKQVWSSEGNFLFIQLKDSKAVLQACRDNAILVRHFIGVKGYEDFLRVTVSLSSHNAVFTRALANVKLTELA